VRVLPDLRKKNPLKVSELNIGVTGLQAQKSESTGVRAFLDEIFYLWEISQPEK